MQQYPTGLGKRSSLSDVEWDDPQVPGREQYCPGAVGCPAPSAPGFNFYWEPLRRRFCGWKGLLPLSLRSFLHLQKTDLLAFFILFCYTFKKMNVKSYKPKGIHQKT